MNGTLIPAVPSLLSVVAGRSGAITGKKRPSDEENDKRKQCHMCSEWYLRVNRHLKDVHGLFFDTFTNTWKEKQREDAYPDMDAI